MNIVILGPMGSGKSTQARLLSAVLTIPAISTGDIFRSLEHDNSLMAKRVRDKITRGLLVTDEDTFAVLAFEFKKPIYQKGVILDGFPRNIFQAQHSPLKFDYAIQLAVSDKIFTERLLLRRREDDTLEIIHRRMEIYHRETEPILKLYETQGILKVINGEQPVPKIFSDVKKSLGLTVI